MILGGTFTNLESDSQIVRYIFTRAARIRQVEDGLVIRNGEQEFRKRAKLRKGDVIEVMEFKVRIV